MYIIAALQESPDTNSLEKVPIREFVENRNGEENKDRDRDIEEIYIMIYSVGTFYIDQF